MTTIEKKGELMTALRQYERWIKDGKKKHGYGKDCQLDYDYYHDHINQLSDNTYEFNIQVFDSPEGDTWWHGKFKLINNCDVEIYDEGYERT